MKAPFPYFGSKARLAKRICALMPTHKQYVEPFFGAGNVFFAKEPCPHETINDLDHGVMNLFTVLRDQPEEFMRLAELTIHSRELWRECREKWAQEEDPVRKAWRWWVVAQGSFSGVWGSSWATSVTHNSAGLTQQCRTLMRNAGELPLIAARLRCTQIECAPALRILERYCTPDSLAYCDPPYVAATRRGHAYQTEMDDADHRAFVSALLRLPGRFLVSGYDHALYAPLECAGWGRLDFDVVAWSAAKTNASGCMGEGGLATQRRTETLWLDPATTREMLRNPQPGLELEEVAG